MEGCYEVSMKIDGASISAFKMHGKIGIASKKTIIKDESSIIYAKYKEGLINSGIWALIISDICTMTIYNSASSVLQS